LNVILNAGLIVNGFNPYRVNPDLLARIVRCSMLFMFFPFREIFIVISMVMAI